MKEDNSSSKCICSKVYLISLENKYLNFTLTEFVNVFYIAN